ncbi:response regulator transcription factor [Solirubrobacter phytolaccae]|uniref:Response regulator transcription factor n=1 Tax=Solirubrobacter phytolaccae TaxID=1404360 RepID=A0A9X3S6M0_9ACTN|nr:response regulator transcription factor [Solirubrobacter phytolaccae]MDA0180049.1 response regulator transcription factor [Solirubrobacter phytolaccae]
MRCLDVLIADDHPLFRFAIARTIQAHPELELVGEARGGREAIELALEYRPELAVVDVEMPGMGAVDVLKAFARESLHTRVLCLAEDLDCETVYALVEAGAHGVLDKSVTRDQILDTLLRVAAGETVLSSDAQIALALAVRRRRENPPVILTVRELEILRFLAAGRSTPAIAAEVYLSPSTVKGHLQRIYERLEVSDRAAAVAEGIRRGLIE